MEFRPGILIALLFICVAVPLAAGYSFNLSSSSDQASVGDAVTLTGSVQGLELPQYILS